jgi:hypothetical protein
MDTGTRTLRTRRDSVGRGVLSGVNDGEWSVFAEKVVGERDEARAECEKLRAERDALREQLRQARWERDSMARDVTLAVKTWASKEGT